MLNGRIALHITTTMQATVSLVLHYLVGLLVTNHLLSAWIYSNFPQHLWNLVHPGSEEVYTKDDLASAAVTRYGSWGDLWVCPLCVGTWIGAGVGSVVFLIGEVPWWFPVVGALSYAGVSYRFNK